MGFNVRYVGAKVAPDTLIADIGYQVDEEVFDHPDQEPYAVWIEETGFSVVVLNGPVFSDAETASLTDLSQSYVISACAVSEFNMHSTAFCLEAGREVWRVHHEGDRPDKTHLVTSGTLPQTFAPLKEKLMAAQMAQTPQQSTQHDQDIPDDIRAIAASIGGSVTLGGAGSAEVDYVFSIPDDLFAGATGYSYSMLVEGDGYRCFILKVPPAQLRTAPRPGLMSRIKGLFS